MRHPLVAALALGAGLGGVLARRGWRRHARRGARALLTRRLSAGVDQVGLALAQATGVSFLDGNRLTWRDNSDVFDAIEQAIAAATSSIHIDVYIWKPGRVGTRLAALVARRARAGIAVRILVDPMGSTGFDRELCAPLREAGCDVRYFRPLRRRPFTITGRNHRRLVVVDGRVGFTGGFGIGDEWGGDGHSPGEWRDANVEVEGPVVRQMQTAFASHWLETGGALLPASELQRARVAGETRAAYVTSMDVKGLTHARWVTHIALMAARRRAWIANAYFVPLPEMLGSLLALSEVGVDVRLLLPGPHQDHRSVTFLQRRLYPRLDRSGLRVFEYQPSMMHAKTMLVDERLVVVGSINLDFLSMEWLEEGCLVVDDRAFAEELERRWEVDIARARQMTGRPVPEPASAQMGLELGPPPM